VEDDVPSHGKPTIGVVAKSPSPNYGVSYDGQNARTFTWPTAPSSMCGNVTVEHYPTIEKPKGAVRAGLPVMHRDLNAIRCNEKYCAMIPEALLGNVR
jgi:hypothetical protein